ncbi:ectonucleotide pyrophosphatase/phosphodiesterase [Mucilaginibacter sp. X4EP1]|uniref:alkaline phosphatase family protein n=1 Tax=Mucilaginibacter sp. X4EP1 TaxID=2723092 RepID=UPI0021677EB5|nr:ectonucleotide pyrophosphatase/phosphodiesterase [Mucilaginibacter sp. X4EP1]
MLNNLFLMDMKKYTVFLVSCFFALGAFAQNDTTQKIVEGRKNSAEQQKKPYVILISADGFRYDYAEKYKATHLQQLANEGVQSPYMVPSFPSVTFPNHYTLVTGLYPSHHGLVDNYFYDRNRKEFYSSGNKAKVADPTWYGGTPLWVLAEQQHMLTASFYWVASEAPIKNTRPTYYYVYNEKINIHNRIQTVVDWLKLPEESRPHLITFYLPQVDHAGHQYGPDAPETEKEVHFVDSAVYELTKAVKTTGLDVNYVFVSDHGMTKIDREHPIGKPDAVDTSKFIVSGDGVMVQLFAKDPKFIKDTYDQLKKEAKDYQVFLSTEMPEKYNYSKADDRYNRIGDIILIPNWPNVFNLNGRKLNVGTHGFDPIVVKEMMATFYAWGPAFKQHTQVSPFKNVDIYPLITTILNLPYTEKIDGTTKLAQQALK